MTIEKAKKKLLALAETMSKEDAEAIYYAIACINQLNKENRTLDSEEI
jgi:hypothetical protein